MIELVRGNLLEADAEALVNTVNTVGVMGKGIALQFKKAFPENFKAYKKACDAKEVQPGKMFLVDLGQLVRPRYIINFPTKRHWKGSSKLEDIEAGLQALVVMVEELGVKSIAVPPLGCGLGGLPWNTVRSLIETAFEKLPSVNVLLFEPAGAPTADKMKIRTKRPKMTAARAAILGLLRRYVVPGYRLSLLEAQKLVYFLKEAGEPLPRVDFVKHKYGPYSDTLRHVLEVMDGHLISGYGDGSNRPDVTIRVLPDAAAEADRFLADAPETRKRFDRVAELITGFETSYGMELLSTVHWVATREDEAAKQDVDASVAGVHAWSDWKRQNFKGQHVRVAWAQLRDHQWLQ